MCIVNEGLVVCPPAREMAQELQREEQAQQSSRQPGTPVRQVSVSISTVHGNA